MDDVDWHTMVSKMDSEGFCLNHSEAFQQVLESLRTFKRQLGGAINFKGEPFVERKITRYCAVCLIPIRNLNETSPSKWKTQTNKKI